MKCMHLLTKMRTIRITMTHQKNDHNYLITRIGQALDFIVVYKYHQNTLLTVLHRVLCYGSAYCNNRDYYQKLRLHYRINQYTWQLESCFTGPHSPGSPEMILSFLLKKICWIEFIWSQWMLICYVMDIYILNTTYGCHLQDVM